MPEYEFELTIIAGTKKITPAILDCPVCAGILRHYEIQFYPGCNGLVSAIIEHWGSQLVPANPDGACSASGYTIAADTYFALDTPPYRLKIKAWASEADYDHVIRVRLDISRLEELGWTSHVVGWLRAIGHVFGASEEENG